MSSLFLDRTIESPDKVYHWLISLHEGLTEAESHLVNARLILLLINQIGDCEAVRQIIELAARSRSAQDKKIPGPTSDPSQK